MALGSVKWRLGPIAGLPGDIARPRIRNRLADSGSQLSDENDTLDLEGHVWGLDGR
jgi:hypothetical protein